MRDNLLFLALISAHFLGDYYLQSKDMAKVKKDQFKMILKHSLYYSFPFLLLPILFENSLGVVFLAIVVHFFIDSVKFFLERKRRKRKLQPKVKEMYIYLLDQTLHILSLLLISSLVSMPLREAAILETINVPKVIRVLPGFLFLFKPANITFKIIFGGFSPKEKGESSIKGAGAVIGSLERILMLIFLGLNQFAAVGLIMTAKSIARYDKISKDPVFAEYYLIGTLYSILITVIIYIIFLF